MTDWYVGQKVVCVDALFLRVKGEWFPVEGSLYTIRSIEIIPDGIGFTLVEIANPMQKYFDGFAFVCSEIIFAHYRFRPVVSQDTDISIFTEILDGVNERKLADAEINQ